MGRVSTGPGPGPGRRPRFSAISSIFGKGVKFAIRDDVVTTEIIGVASEDSRRLAAVLHRSVYLSGLHFTVDGRDTHYFVKAGLLEEDLGVVGHGGAGRVLENGVNLTVSQMTTVVGGRTRRFADIQMLHGALCFSVRYGATEEEERAHVLEGARQRGVEQAWASERRRVEEGDAGSRPWTEEERQQLISSGQVPGYDGSLVLPVEQYPELSDSANNIHFTRQSETGSR